MHTETKPAANAAACTMPNHGREDALSPCCRPSSPQFTGYNFPPPPVHQTPRWLFWTDRNAWRKAASNTFNCLIGCMIGDLAVIVGFQAFYPAAPMSLTMPLGMIAGLVTSILFEGAMLRWREGFAWRRAFTTAFSMSFLSMLGMEAAANATDFMLTGGRVPLSDPFYWQALGISVAAGFLAPLPYNYWQFKRHGKACH